jgi:hypothetical protein
VFDNTTFKCYTLIHSFDRMSSFPPLNWESRLVDDFESFAGSPRPDGKLAVTAAMAVRLLEIIKYKRA